MIKKFFLILVILSIVILLPSAAQSKETLAVLDFTTEAVSSTEMNAIVEFLSAELFNTDKYIVIDVSQRETILSEMEFSMSGCSDDSCALEIGKLLSAELIVVGNLSKVGSRYLLSVKMLQTETSRTVGTANGKFTDLDGLIDGLEEIALTLTGMEEEEAAKPEPEPVTEPLPAAAEAEADKPAAEDTGSGETAAEAETKAQSSEQEPTARKPEPAAGNFDVLSLTLSSAGAVSFAGSGIFMAMAVSDLLASLDAYNAYMSAEADPGYLYYNEDDGSYIDYYEAYSSNTLIGYITAGLGGGLSAASNFFGDRTLSFGGKIVSAAGTFALAAGNILAVAAANYAVANRQLYDDYMTADSPERAAVLYDDYAEVYNTYSVNRALSYGLWGAGGLLTAASGFIPGERNTAVSSFAEKLISGLGYLCLAGGNYANSMALSQLINAEDTYDEYMLAGTSETAGALYGNYESYQSRYEGFTYISYGLWGAGAAAVITALLIPESTDHINTADARPDFSVRPALTGFGFEVDIKLR